MHRTGVWAVVGILMIAVLDGVGNACVFANLTMNLTTPMRALVLLVAVADAVLAIWLYVTVIMRRWARRRAVEVVQPDWARNLGWGLLLGLVYILLLSGVIAALGGLQIDGFASHYSISDALSALTVGVVAGTLEELLIRGIVLHAVERWRGWFPALVVSALLFGALHGYNAHAGWLTVVGIMVSAGIYLGVVMLWRRSLWIAIGFHAAWDITVALTGVPIEAGTPPIGLLDVHTTGPAFLNGGEYGYEGSIVNVVFGLVVTVPFLIPRFRRWFASRMLHRDDRLLASTSVGEHEELSSRSQS